MPRTLPTLAALALAATHLLAPSAVEAAEFTLDIEIPRLEVAEYHRPYVAAWLERADHSVAAQLAVWYDLKKRNDEGQKWLKDLRQWWRRGGRELTLPMDGVSSATRAPGRHSISFAEGASPLGRLPAGDYTLVVEASRESGGREVVSLPLSWPPKTAGSSDAKGAHELGAISVHYKP